MKTFRLLGMALVAVMMCVNFAACSSSDDDDNGVNSSNLEGDWFITRYEGYENGKENTFEYVYSQANYTNEDEPERLVISASAVTKDEYTLSNYYYISGAWKKSNSYAITVAGNMISGFSYNGITSWKIVSVSKSKLVIEGSLSGTKERYGKFTCEPFRN